MIEIGYFCAPCLHILHVEFHALRQGRSRQCGRSHFVSIGISENEIDLPHTLNSSVNCEYTILVIVGKVTNNTNIVETILPATCIKIAVTIETSVTEIILVLKIMSIAHSQHLNGNKILLPHLYIFSKVKLGFQFVVLAIAYELAIDPKVHTATGGSEVSNDLLSSPRCGNGDTASIIADMILLDGYKRRVALGSMVPDETSTHIDGIAKAIEFPASGHGDGFPIRSFVLSSVEAIEHLVGIGLPTEVPSTVQAPITLRSLRHTTLGDLETLVGKVMCMHRHTVHLIDVGPLPCLGSFLWHTRHSRNLIETLRNREGVFENGFLRLSLRKDCSCHSRKHC